MEFHHPEETKGRFSFWAFLSQDVARGPMGSPLANVKEADMREKLDRLEKSKVFGSTTKTMSPDEAQSSIL